MADTALIPPAVPGQEQPIKGGFLKKFFLKDEASKTTEPLADEVDLEDIKRKLGLLEETPSLEEAPKSEEIEKEQVTPQEVPAEEAPAPPPDTPEEPAAKPAPLEHVDIDDWSSEDEEKPAEELDPDVESEDTVESLDTKPESMEEKYKPPMPGIADEHEDLSIEPEEETPEEEKEDSDNLIEPEEEEPHEENNPSSFDVNDWSESEKSEDSTDSTWSGDESEEGLPTFAENIPEHHTALDEVMGKLEDHHSELGEKLADKRDLPVPDWELHEKEVPEDQYFLLKNGHPIRSLNELISALEFLDDSTLEHHMGEHKNDFANWIRDVIGQSELADEVADTTTREEIMSVLENHRESVKTDIGKHKKTLEKHHSDIKKIYEKIEKATEKAQKKHEDLTNLQAHGTKKVRDSLDREVSNRLAEARQEHNQALDELNRGRRLYENSASDYDKRLAKVEKQEHAMESREEKLKAQQEKLKAQREEFRHEKDNAKEILKDAVSSQKEIEAAQKVREEAQQMLENAHKVESDVAERENALKEREEKFSQEIATIKEEEEKLEDLRAESDAREVDISAREEAAQRTVADAETRRAEALESERIATAKIKAETRKLDAVRNTIETKLKEVLKNKKKSVYAAELRKHLEEAVKSTKHEIVKEREALRDEAFKSYTDSKVDTTPPGQKSKYQHDEVEKVKNLDVYKKVEQARSALEQKDLDTAKKLYNELRDEFPGVDVPTPERNVLYTSIRELYDDIHLSMLEQ
ncbi:hypothetical protein GOV11_02855 [Candidatus Woesearchaeota archaeon]|nr:hypothetical protein [Candidatus Woesearchaeota archaeon]